MKKRSLQFISSPAFITAIFFILVCSAISCRHSGAPDPDSTPQTSLPGKEQDQIKEHPDEVVIDSPEDYYSDEMSDFPDPSGVYGKRIVINPEHPVSGEPIEIRSGPITFRNGCEGIERSWHTGPDESREINLFWAPRQVPADAMCTMALHTQWIKVVIEGLEAGEYTIIDQDTVRLMTVEDAE